MTSALKDPSEVDVSLLRPVSDGSGLLGDRVYGALRQAILSLDFKPGERIRKEPICDSLKVSRSPVADALKRLAGERLVEIIPQSGTRVSKLSLPRIREESFLREALEVAAVARAAETRTNQDYARLARNLRMQELLVEDDDFAEFYRADEEFHRLIMDACGISTLPAAVRMMSLQVSRARLLLLPEPGRPRETVEEHRRILKAIEARDPSAAADAMRRHLRQLIKRLEPLEADRHDLFET